MAHEHTPLFHNTVGAHRVRIGAREFMCMGALPPLDHPHEFLDMGGDNETICPYCSTVYAFDPGLKPGQAVPAECVTSPTVARGAIA